MSANPLSSARRVVVKVGSALLVDRKSGLKHDWLAALADDICALTKGGAEVMVVSSGAIALGRTILGLKAAQLKLEESQAAASVGQIALASAWSRELGRHDTVSGQVLVTLGDTEERRRYLNVRATISTLLKMKAVPVINENDTVATSEIRYGDNDRLAAQIAVTVGADQLILLSDVDGFYSANPKEDPTARRFDIVDRITPEIEAMAGDPVSGLSKGGMKTKLMAAKTAVSGGCAMAIMEGSVERPLSALTAGAACTWFLPQGDPQVARKRWIAAMKPRGEVTLDAGAVAALRQGKSLLPAGVTGVSGRFGRGDAVAILGPDGAAEGVGLIRYTADEARAIAGRRSGDIEGILGYAGRGPMVHRDDMAL